MPKSSRHKSHKQSKHREHSDSEDDSKRTVKESSIRVSSISGEKRKSSILHSREIKDISGHANLDAVDEFVVSKRRKDRSEVGDRWNGGADGELKSESSVKLKTLIESKSKSSRKHDVAIEKKDDYAGLVMEKEESRSGKSELKRKSEKERIKEKDYIEKERPAKDSSRKEASQYKDSKEKERGLEREKKERERGLEPRGVDGDAKRKQGSQIVDVVDAHKAKRSSENTERSLQDDLRSHKIEKEVDKRTERKGDVTGEKEKYQADKRVSDNRHTSSRGERDRDGRYKDEKHNDGSYKDESLKDEMYKNGSYRDRYKDDVYRESRHWEGNQKEDIDKDKRHRTEKYRDERDYRDRPVDKSEYKYSRDDHDGAENRNKKYHPESVNRDGSPVYPDRSSRYKDDKGKRTSDDKEISNDLRSRNMNEQRSDFEKKVISIGKSEPTADRERPRTRHDDMDSSVNHSRQRSSPNSSAVVAKDQYRYSKQADSTYRDRNIVHEERASHFVSSTREVGGTNSGFPQKTNLSRSMDNKFISKDEGHMGNVSADKRMNSDTRSPPVQSREKSPTASNDRRPSNRSGSVRRNLDVEDSGIKRGNSRDYSVSESKVGQDSPMDSYSVNEHSQPDGENISASSPFIRTNYQSTHSKSLLPLPSPYRPGPDNSSGFNSYDDDNRGEPNNRFKRIGDPNMGNMGRVQGNSWKGVPTWPSPVSNGFMPFPHGQPPVGFHPMMQQFPVPPMFGVRPPSMELNHPFHYSDGDRFSNHIRPFGWRNPGEDSGPGLLQGWDLNSGALGDGSHMYGRQDWDHNRNNLSNAPWETNVDTWKGQSTGMVLKSPSVPKEENSVDIVDEVMKLTGQLGQQAEKEQIQLDLKENNLHISALKTMPEKTSGKSKVAKDNKILFLQHYLSKLDISEKLVSPELFKELSGLMAVKQNARANLFASRFLDVEGADTETRVKISTNVTCASLFPPANEFNLKRAMSLIKMGKDKMLAPFLPFLPKSGGVPFSNIANVDILSTTNKEDVTFHIASPDGDTGEQMASMKNGMQETESPITILNLENEGTETVPQKIEDPLIEKDEIISETQEEDVKMEVDLVGDEDVSKYVESIPINTKTGPEIDEEKLVDTEAMMPELNDLESVNLSRIHHLPESTH